MERIRMGARGDNGGVDEDLSAQAVFEVPV